MNKILTLSAKETLYYKQHCFGLTAATLLDKSVSIHTVATYTNTTPSHFSCLLVKLLELEPSRDIIEFYIAQPRFKYLKLLGLLYHRLVYKDREYLMQLIDSDYRKIRVYSQNEYSLTYMDECIDALVTRSDFHGFTLTEMA